MPMTIMVVIIMGMRFTLTIMDMVVRPVDNCLVMSMVVSMRLAAVIHVDTVVGPVDDNLIMLVVPSVVVRLAAVVNVDIVIITIDDCLMTVVVVVMVRRPLEHIAEKSVGVRVLAIASIPDSNATNLDKRIKRIPGVSICRSCLGSL